MSIQQTSQGLSPSNGLNGSNLEPNQNTRKGPQVRVVGEKGSLRTKLEGEGSTPKVVELLQSPRDLETGPMSELSVLPKGNNDSFDFGPLPRKKRRPIRAKQDRGLPPDEEIAKFAKEYLERQRKHWSNMVEAGLLPYADSDMLTMVEDFKLRHRTAQVELNHVKPFLKICKKLAGAYCRYSCDNSSTNSILDQMVKILDKAAAEQRFIPWSYVCADYSVTGLDASRQGYSSYKKILNDEDQLIETTYIDDFTRASRDEIEWWKLGWQIKRLNKRMMGASDGFDLSSPDADLKITLYGLVSRLFIKSLREKTRRGMCGAARRGTCLGAQSLGFTKRVALDGAGKPILKPNGLPRHEVCHDPGTMDAARSAFDLCSNQKWSRFRIAKHFNALKIDDRDNWTSAGIKQLLKNPNYIGVFIWNKSRTEFDWEKEAFVRIRNPRSQWVVKYKPEMALIPMVLWRATQRRLAVASRSGRPVGFRLSRNQVSATTLFSGTLICGYESTELTLIRSGKRQKSLGCLHGHAGSHGCQLTSSKSTRIIENCLLDFIFGKVLTEERLTKLVVNGNDYVLREAKKPRIDTRPLQAEAKSIKSKIKKFMALIESTNDDEQDLCKSYDARVKELHKSLNGVMSQIRQAEASNQPPPPLLDLGRVKELVGDLRALLNTSIPAAAEAIRALTGPIMITQEKIPGRKSGARWIATFSPRFLEFLKKMAKDKNIPDAVTLGILCDRIWNVEEPMQVLLEDISPMLRRGRQIKKMLDDGQEFPTVAAKLGMNYSHAKRALEYAITGQPHRRVKNAAKAPAEQRKKVSYKDIIQDVVRMHDRERVPFNQIAKRLGACELTIVRAYNAGRPDIIEEALKTGTKPKHENVARMPPAVRERMRAMLVQGKMPQLIADMLGCSDVTVRSQWKHLPKELRDEGMRNRGNAARKNVRLSAKDYERIDALLRDGRSVKSIAKEMKRPITTIYGVRAKMRREEGKNSSQ